MSPNAHRLLEEARQVLPRELNWLIGELLQDGDGSNEAEIETSWKAEVERRVANIDAGNGATYSWKKWRRRCVPGWPSESDAS